MSRDYTIEQVAEMAHQIEIICAMWEDYPNTMADSEISALATLIKRLSGNVAAWLIEEQADRGSKR